MPDIFIYSREQIFIAASYAAALKEFEKAVLRAANGAPMDERSLLKFAAEWFATRCVEERDRRAREQAWRQYWSGKRGQVKALFDEFDVDRSGHLTRDEVEKVLQRFGGAGFFGYTDDPAFAADDMDGMAEWMNDAIEGGVGATDLFSRLDSNKVPPHFMHLTTTHTFMSIAHALKYVNAGRAG